MTANRSPTSDELNGKNQDTVQWPAKAYRVVLVDSDGNEITSLIPITVTNVVYEERRTYNAQGQVEYIGEAVPGTEDDGTVWRIHKRTYTDNKLTKISWADYNGDFDKTWDDRATYDYR